MSKVLAALLCCGSNTRSSRSTPVSPRNVQQAAASPTLTTSVPNPNPLQQNLDDSLSRKDVLDDDHSVNEADTIANTNELPPEADSANVPHTPNVPDPVVASSIIASVPESSPPDLAPLTLSNSTDTVNDSLGDLTKLQDGQAFFPGTSHLLGPKDPRFEKKKCLILDLDETLVHLSFKYLRNADFVIPVEIDNVTHHVYVIKRPGVDEFLQKVGQWYEVVVFTASVLKYGNPLLDKLDIHHVVHHRLFRDSCYNYQGNYIKNLSQMGRPLVDLIIIDNSPASYIFHPQHSLPISSWFSDTHDNELLDLLPILADLAEPAVQDVSLVLDSRLDS